MSTTKTAPKYTGEHKDTYLGMFKFLLLTADEYMVTLLNSGNENEGEAIAYGNLLKNLQRQVNDRVNNFDKMVDKVHDGTKGAKYMPKLERIHQPRGRTAGVKVEVTIDDKLAELGL